MSLLAQVPANRYEPLQQALGLSDFQLWQAQQKSPDYPPAPRASLSYAGRRSFQNGTETPVTNLLADRILDNSQKAKLAEIEKVLLSERMASLTVVLGLISAQQWPGGFQCPFYPIPAYASELGLSEAQSSNWSSCNWQRGSPHTPWLGRIGTNGKR
jgi:hypothetical protein